MWALYAAIAMPVIYFGTQLVAAPFYPDYSFSRDTASMLGTTDSHHPWIFNLGAMLTGVAGLVGGRNDSPDRKQFEHRILERGQFSAVNPVLSG